MILYNSSYLAVYTVTPPPKTYDCALGITTVTQISSSFMHSDS